jgi:hypothetical protein
MPKTLQINILKRVLTENEMDILLQRYVAEAHKFLSIPFSMSAEDILFSKSKPTLEEWKQHWNLKSEATVLRRLGKFFLTQ